MNGATYTANNEGCRLAAYQDTRGVWTVGVGCSGTDPYCSPAPEIGPSTVWTQEQANAQFNTRYMLARQRASDDLGAGAWAAISTVRQAALTDMAFQMGGAGLAEFQQMLAAVRSSVWQAAHDACLDSAYDRQTPERAQRNANMLLTGQWPS